MKKLTKEVVLAMTGVFWINVFREIIEKSQRNGNVGIFNDRFTSPQYHLN